MNSTMPSNPIFKFKTEKLSRLDIPKQLNNPFATSIPKIAQIAAQEFQDYIKHASQHWEYNFKLQKGKMFGVMVVQQNDGSLAYLGTISGTLLAKDPNHKLVASIFNESESNAILSNGLNKLARINKEINSTQDQKKIQRLKEKRKQHSKELQKTLFTKTKIINQQGEYKNVLEIFSDFEASYPPAAAGECAAPKLLQYAFQQKLKPIALAEFWWGNTTISKKREHLHFYPACTEKCKPILEYMLENQNLFNTANPTEAGNQ